jgi:hypothetical protein
MYMTRARYPSGFRKAPERQPHDRVGIVLSGTLYVGFGERFSEQSIVAVPKGGTWTMPARSSCYMWAKEGDVVLQVIGNGESRERVQG